MPSLATIPVYPAPGKQTTITVALTQSGSNYVRVWCTNAPPGSELRRKIDGTNDPRNRVEVYEGDGGANSPWRLSFDKGGKYTFAAQEYTKGAAAFGGGYQDDPSGATSELKVGAESTLSLYIGQRMTANISANQDSVEIVFWVWNTTIRETTIAVHGEASPALIKESPTDRELAAIESTLVQTALTNLIGANQSTAIGTPSTILSNIVTEYNDHRVLAGVHAANDASNVAAAGLASAPSASTLKDLVNEMLRLFRQHYTNDAVQGGTVSGRDSGGYHDVGGKKNDNINMPLLQGVNDVSAYWGLADLHRSYEAHRVSTAVHSAADATNALTALPLLLKVASAVFVIWASNSPVVPDTQSSLAMALIGAAGFSETPLES